MNKLLNDSKTVYYKVQNVQKIRVDKFPKASIKFELLSFSQSILTIVVNM